MKRLSAASGPITAEWLGGEMFSCVSPDSRDLADAIVVRDRLTEPYLPGVTKATHEEKIAAVLAAMMECAFQAGVRVGAGK